MHTLHNRSDADVSSLVDSIIDTWITVYSYKFMGKSSTEFDYISKRTGWAWAIRPFSAQVLAQAVDRVLNPGPHYKTFDWPPTPKEFFDICKSFCPNYKQNTSPKADPFNLSSLLHEFKSLDNS